MRSAASYQRLCPSCSRDSRASFIAQVPATKQGSTSWPVGLALECAYCVTVLLRVSTLVCVCGTVVCVRHSGVCAAQWCVCGTVRAHSPLRVSVLGVCAAQCGAAQCGAAQWCVCGTVRAHSPLRTECVNYAYRVWPRVWWPRRTRSMTHDPIFYMYNFLERLYCQRGRVCRCRSSALESCLRSKFLPQPYAYCEVPA